MLDPHDIQSRLGIGGLAIHMQEAWAAAFIYLHDAGDVEGAMEAAKEADRWKEIADLAQCDPYIER